MISYLKGTIQSKDLKSLILNVSGVGYQVHTTPSFLEKSVQGQEIELYTHLHVREDCQELYGFQKKEELEFFTKLISVSGIGPKSALGVFALAKVAEIKQAIANGDIAFLTRLSGIGKKTAERVVVDLRGKIDLTDPAPGLTGSNSDAVEALTGLGYSHSQAIEALRQSTAETVEDRLKQALKILGKK
ncbi:Holliday junction branch migration protein RuvA [Candidatus Falkowbacteria bacterium]|nr:Holliday junction branch migration protein RuvA [Candidatus Falkowbacteria bacterium]